MQSKQKKGNNKGQRLKKEKNQWNQNFFEKINNIDKPLASVTKKQKREDSIY